MAGVWTHCSNYATLPFSVGGGLYSGAYYTCDGFMCSSVEEPQRVPWECVFFPRSGPSLPEQQPSAHFLVIISQHTNLTTYMINYSNLFIANNIFCCFLHTFNVNLMNINKIVTMLLNLSGSIQTASLLYKNYNAARPVWMLRLINVCSKTRA